MKKDGILIGVLFIIIGIMAILITSFRQEAKYAYVYHYNDLIMKIDLGIDEEYIILDGDMIIVVKEKKIGVKESNCKDHLCIEMGMTNNSNSPIICAPNGICIKFVGNSRDVVIG